MTTSPAVALTHRLSTTQRKFLASRSRSGGAPVQSVTHLIRIDGSIDPDRLAAAFEQVVRSSDILRTQIPSGEKAVVTAGLVHRAEVVRLDVEQVDAWAATRAASPLDLTISAWDCVVLDHGSGLVTWYLNLDHLVTDATTTAAIVSATGAAYEGETLDIPSWYGWVRRTQARSERGTRPTASSGGLPSQLYTSAKPGIATSSRHTLVADDQLESQVRDALGSRLRLLGDELSWTALLVASTALWVHQLTARSEITLGVPVHHRSSEEAEQLFGPLVDLHPVTIAIDPTETAARFHKRVSRALLGMLADAQNGTEPSSNFDVVVNIIPNSGDADFGGRSLIIDWLAPQAIDPAHVARIQLTGYGQGLKIDMDINHGASNAEHRDRAPAHFRAALLHLVESPESLIGDADLLTNNDRHMLDQWESGGPGFADQVWVGTALQQRLGTNDDVVVHDLAGDLTGRELWTWASNIGRHLRSQGVRPGDRVSVELDPSVQALAAIYGIVAAGCSFVPLDPSQPASRRSELAAVAQCRVRFDQPSALDGLRTVEPSLEDGLLEDGQFQDGLLQDGQLAAEAYLLFTSGSTGTPKGVPILHHGLASYIQFALESYFEAGVPTAPLYTSLGFDLTITTLFAPILAGGSLVMPGAGASALPRIAADDRITWIKATPSHLEILTRLLPSGSALATAVVGGESFPSRLARRLIDSLPTLTLFNEYGPTEAVVGCMIHQAAPAELTANSEVSIGRPAPGVELRIATATGGRVPVGAVGELLISHDGVTAGYIGAQDQPDQPFVEIDGRRWYRSGDLVRLRDDALCEFLGRVDTQLKVGGRRLDPIEVEDALAAHPAVDRAAVRLHQPQRLSPSRYCARCGLPDTVPGASFDDEDVCATCRSYEAVAPAAAGYFGTLDDLAALLEQSRSRSGTYDCVHLLSGGKDSTYALYQLVELGYRPYVLTLDNGYISDGAKQNIRRTVAHLGLDHEFASTPHMDEIFRDSLATYSNVCNGCYKTIYILATRRAAELGIGAIVTGLSRGQLFETRLLPAQFRGSVDPEEIDRSVLRARMRYHRAPDLPNQLLGTEIFERDGLFEEIEYLDFYRYTDVELSEMLEYLGTKTAWERPADTGRSTNCLINIAGIHTHQLEQGYHNYAIPYAWDVRLGHKTRDEAIAELDDDPELDAVARLLGEVGYTPSPSQTLTAWVEPVDGAVMPSGTELRAWLSSRIAPWAIPAAFVVVEELPTTTNGKLDESRLPPPARVHRPGVEAILAPTTVTEEAILHIWERVLNLEPIGSDDDFFALGGDSLAALTALAELADVLDRVIPDELGFIHTTAGELGAAVDQLEPDSPTTQGAPLAIPLREASVAPQVTAAEAGVLFEQRQRPDQVMYNLGRRFSVAGVVSPERWLGALEAVVAHEATLSWTYGSQRLPIDASRRVEATLADDAVSVAEASERIVRAHRVPFDLEHGPLLRCVVQPIDDGTTEIAMIIHHVCGDRTSLDLLFARTQQAMATQVAAPRAHDYAEIWAAQRATDDRAFWINDGTNLPVAGPTFEGASDDDGLLTRVATAGAADLLSVRGAAATTIVTAAAARAIAPAFTDGRVELALLGSARTIPEATDCFGYFLNPLPLLVTASGSDADDHAVTLTETARQLGRKLAHRAYPFSSIVAARRDAGLHVPDGRVLVAWDEGSTLSCDGHDVTASALFNGSAVTDLTLFAEVRGDELALSIEFNGTKVGRSAADAILERFDVAITDMIGAAPRIGSAAVIERTRSVISGPALARTDSIYSRLVRRLGAASSSPAITVDGVTWSDADLASRVDGIAAQLRDCGVVVGDRVAVMLPRGHDLVAAMLATQIVGAAYVPIDPEYPMRRRVAVIEQANARCVITEQDRAENLGAPVIDPNTAAPAQAEFGDLDPDPNREAYVIFTSGSTGEPRGVAVTSAQLDASTNARRQVYEQAPRSFLLLSSAAFDSSIVGLFWTLAEGGELVIPTDDQAHDVDRLCTVIDTTAPSHVLCVPTLYRALLARRVGETWPTQVIVAGEACDSALVRLHFENVADSALTNEYGPTEATVWATAHHCHPNDEPVPIGTPIPGVWVAVVAPDGSLCGAGESGELVIGGAGVTNGYVNDPEETARRFGSDLTEDLVGPYFRTGDRVRTQGNTVYFLGRLDEQLNLGGLRVEPGEIEAALVTVPGVAAAIAGAVDARSLEELVEHASDDELRTAFLQSSESDDPRHTLRSALLSGGEPDLLIAAWLEAPNGVDEADLKRTVEEQLGPLVRPRRWVAVAELPRLANGKIDRAASMRIELPLPNAVAGSSLAGSSSSGGTRHDDSDAIAAVCDIFASVLRVNTVGPDDSFFDLGGHSLLALELLGAVEERFGTRLSTTVIFTEGTPRGIAASLGTTSRSVAGSAHQLIIPIQTEGARPPIFAINNLGTNGEYFRPLSAELGNDQPIYGLGSGERFDMYGVASYDPDSEVSVEEIAARCVQSIEELAPDGPVVLAGLCGGAIHAYEVAQQLTARGRTVASFIMLNDWQAPGLGGDQNHSPRENLRRRLNNLVTLRGEYLPWIYGPLKRRAELLELQVLTRLGRPLSHRQRVRKYIEESVASMNNYDYLPYGGPTTVLRGRDDPRLAGQEGVGWQGLLTNVAYEPIDAIGIDLLMSDAVVQTAASFRAAIDRGLQTETNSRSSSSG